MEHDSVADLVVEEGVGGGAPQVAVEDEAEGGEAGALLDANRIEVKAEGQEAGEGGLEGEDGGRIVKIHAAHVVGGDQQAEALRCGRE
eukprot:evm.model.NODE_20609_length_13178_cov_21.577326.2